MPCTREFVTYIKEEKLKKACAFPSPVVIIWVVGNRENVSLCVDI